MKRCHRTARSACADNIYKNRAGSRERQSARERARARERERDTFTQPGLRNQKIYVQGRSVGSDRCL